MPDPDLDELREGLEKVVRAHRLTTLKGWGQATCEHCGGPLETLFDPDGRDPIRVCIPCEQEN